MHAYIVVKDSQFQFPVLRTDVERIGRSETDVKRMDPEQYGAWCSDVPMDRSHGEPGTQGCIDYCNELVETGAEVWDIG